MDGDKDESGEEVVASPTALSGRVPSEGKDTDLADLVENVGREILVSRSGESWVIGGNGGSCGSKMC